MSSSNAWAEFAAIYSRTCSAHLEHEHAKAELRRLMPNNAQQAIGRYPGQTLENGGYQLCRAEIE